MSEPSDFIPNDQADSFLCIPDSLGTSRPAVASTLPPSSGYVLPPSSPSPPPSPNSCPFVGAPGQRNSSPPTFSPGQTGSVQVITGEEFYNVESSEVSYVAGTPSTSEQPAPEVTSTLCPHTGLPYEDHNYSEPMSRAPRSHKFTGSQSRSITLTINDVLPSRPPPPSIHSLSDFSHRYFQPAGTSDDPHNETDKNFPPGSVRFMTNGAFVGRFKTSDTVSTGRIPKSSPFLTQSVGQKATPVLTVYPSSVGGSKVYQLVKDEVPQTSRAFTAETPIKSRYSSGNVPFFLSPADEVISNVTANEESDAEIAAPEQMLRVSAANTLASLNANSLFNRYSLDRTENDVRIVGEQMAQGSWMSSKLSQKDKKKRVYKTSLSSEGRTKLQSEVANAAVLQKKNEVQKAYEKTLRALGPLLSPRSSDRESSSSEEEEKSRTPSVLKIQEKKPGKRGRPPGSRPKGTVPLSKPKPTKKPAKGESEEEEEQWHEPYTTRCICGYTHNDDFMIECDKCNVWQHGDCVGIKRSKVPTKYLCELCDLRYLDKEKARKLQRRKRKEDGYSSSDSEEGKPKEIVMHKSPVRNNFSSEAQRLEPMGYLERYEEAFLNDYSSGIKQAIKANGSTAGGALLLERLKVKLCDVMDVEAGRQGLVAVRTVPPGQPIVEFRGQFTLNSETDLTSILSRPHPFVLFYSLVGTENAEVFVDARKIGNAGRFVRRSCQANSVVTHVIEGQSLHMIVVAKELIERGTEISIPFDFDFAQSSFLVECACTRPDCLVKAHNSNLFPSTDTSGDVPQSEVEIDSSPTRKGRKPGPKKDKTKLQKKRNISESKKMKNKDGKMKDKGKKWKVKFGASSAKLAAAQKMHKAISAMRASIKPVNKILDAAVAAEVQISEAETSTHQSQKKFKKKADRLEAQEHESHSEKLSREDKKLQGLMARFEKMDKPKPKGKVGRPKGKGGKSKELSDLSAEVEFIRQRANSRQDSITTDQSIGSGDEHSESAKAKSKRARSFELSGLEDYWTKKESTGMKEESWLLPTERQGHVSREDRKAQEYMARLERLEQMKAKKRKRSVSSGSSVKVKIENDSDDLAVSQIKTVAAKKASPSARSSKRNFSGSGSSSDNDAKRSPRKASNQARLPPLKKNTVSDWLEDSQKSSEEVDVLDTSHLKANQTSASEGIPARKRWLRQAMSETEQADQAAVSSTPGTPLKKRRVVDEEATGSTEPQISDSKVDSSVDVVRVEIADTPFSCALRSIYSGGQETEDFLERELNALKEERMEQPVRSINDTCVSAADSTTPNNWSGDLVEPQSSTSVSEEIEVKPEPTECHVEPSKKKVSLSEYRQRKKEAPTTSKDTPKPSGLAHSFSVPAESTVSSAADEPILPTFSLPPVPGIITKGSRLTGSTDLEPKIPRLSAPIPANIANKGASVSFDELKERIYGRTAVSHCSESADGTPPPDFRSSRPKTPPPSVDSSQISSDEATPSSESHRMSLSERLRMEFGVEAEPDATHNIQANVNLLGANLPGIVAPGVGVTPDLSGLPLVAANLRPQPSMPGMGVPPHMPAVAPLPPVMMQQMQQMGQIAMRMVSAMNHMMALSTSSQPVNVVPSQPVSMGSGNVAPVAAGRESRTRSGVDGSDWPTDESRPRSSNDSHRSSHRPYNGRDGRGRNRFP